MFRASDNTIDNQQYYVKRQPDFTEIFSQTSRGKTFLLIEYFFN